MTFVRLNVLLVAATLLLNGCASSHLAPVRGGDSEPVYRGSNTAPASQPIRVVGSPVGNDTVVIKAQQKRVTLQPKVSTKKARHDTKIGVIHLLASAENYSGKNKWMKAQNVLERAQRIDPKEPKVYYELAVVHLKKSQPRQAEQLSRKGLSLAHGNPTLKRELWQLLSKALQAQGKEKQAQKALQRAYKIEV